MRSIILIVLTVGTIHGTASMNLEFLDPTKLQTKTAPKIQEEAAKDIISNYLGGVVVVVDPLLFQDSKDVFSINTHDNKLNIKASTGVAALWGFNYYLKKYCNSQVSWQVNNVNIPDVLPEVNEVVVANDRLRYYQNVCTASYSFVWWDSDKWKEHVKWMALNGINIALAPVAQEAAWARIYKQLGMTDDEIDEHFTGPAFLSWLRMGNVRGWAGPIPKSWHSRQIQIQNVVMEQMFALGMIPVLPAFSGHVPKAFARLYPNSTFYSVDPWNKFKDNYCCSLYVKPSDPVFEKIGTMFLREISVGSGTNHIYSADPFNEIKVTPWAPNLTEAASRAIFNAMTKVDPRAVWLLQNWMFVHDPVLWPESKVKAFLTSVPNGRMLILDLQAEQWPQYNLYKMYYGQPFIWCMLHNFGGTLGMFGNMKTINGEVYATRTRDNSTMIGIGLTPEGINQNYVVYDLMLESAWRKEPVGDLNEWAAEYAYRRYACNGTERAWRYLLKSVYSYDGPYNVRGKYVITRRPSMNIRPWAWYSSRDLTEAWRSFVTVDCDSAGFKHDLVDVTRQALQYRADQLYLDVVAQRRANTWAFNASVEQFLDIMQDLELILATNDDFTAGQWFSDASNMGTNDAERYIYELNAKNQITLWGPNGEITDYACKQWAELFHYYYIPRWRAFLSAALDAKTRGEVFDEGATQRMVRATIESKFISTKVENLPSGNSRRLATQLFSKWGSAWNLAELRRAPATRTRPSLSPTDYTVVMSPTTTSD